MLGGIMGQLFVRSRVPPTMPLTWECPRCLLLPSERWEKPPRAPGLRKCERSQGPGGARSLWRWGSVIFTHVGGG